MSKNSENIVEVIDELKQTNEQSDRTFKFMLEEISRKLEDIGDGKEFVYVRNTISDLKKNMGERFEEICDAVDKIKENIQNTSQNDVIDLYSEKFKSAAETFDNNINSLADRLSSLYDEFKLETGENFSTLKKSLDKVSKAISAHNLEITDMNKSLEEVNEHLVSSLLQETNKFKSEIKAQGEDISNILDEKFDDLKTSITNNNHDMLEEDIKNYFSQYCSKITEITDIIVNLRNELALSKEDYGKFAQDFEKNMNVLNIDFQAACSGISDELKDEYNQKFENFQKFIIDNASTYETHVADTERNLKEELDKFREEIQSKFSVIIDASENNSTIIKKYEDLLNELLIKTDIIAKTDYSFDLDNLTEQSEEVKDIVDDMNYKLNDLVQKLSDDDENKNLISKRIQGLVAKITQISDILVNSKSKEIYALNLEIENLIKEVQNNINNLNFSDVISQIISMFEKTENRLSFLLEEAKDTTNKGLNEINSSLEVHKNILDELNAKLDIFAASNENELLEDELLELKDIIISQEELLKSSEKGLTAKAESNFKDIISKIDNVTQTISEHENNAEKIKENIIETIVSVFNNTDFTEESEDIKGFVEEKTDELNKQIHDVKSQLKTIKENEITDYSYTLSDVEQDIAHLRGAIKDVTSSTPVAEINQISRNIHNLTSSIDAISKNLTPAEIFQLKHGILKLNDDILSISSRTNKLLINSDEASKTISDGVEAFSHIAYNLEERIKEFSNRELVVQIADKLERSLMLAENAAVSDATVQKVLMFLGEWVDAVSETFENINTKTDDIASVLAFVKDINSKADEIQPVLSLVKDINDKTEEIKPVLSHVNDIKNNTDEIENISKVLSELREIVPEKTELLNKFEESFEEQQTRIDRLESKLDKLNELVAKNDIGAVLQKMDKLENIILTQNKNIEKLTSYVE